VLIAAFAWPLFLMAERSLRRPSKSSKSSTEAFWNWIFCDSTLGRGVPKPASMDLVASANSYPKRRRRRRRRRRREEGSEKIN